MKNHETITGCELRDCDHGGQELVVYSRRSKMTLSAVEIFGGATVYHPVNEFYTHEERYTDPYMIELMIERVKSEVNL